MLTQLLLACTVFTSSGNINELLNSYAPQYSLANEKLLVYRRPAENEAVDTLRQNDLIELKELVKDKEKFWYKIAYNTGQSRGWICGWNDEWKLDWEASPIIKMHLARGEAYLEHAVNRDSLYDYLEKAEQEFKRLVEVAKFWPEAYLKLSKVYELEGKLEKATEFLEAAKNISPSCEELSYFLANFYLKLDQPAKAKEEFRKVIKFNGKYRAFAENWLNNN